jgi:hypothetical protein
MKILFILLLLTGCAGKGLKVELEVDGKKVLVETDYQIENGFTMKRNIETGYYEIELGSATTKDADTNLMMMMFQMLLQTRGISLPPQEIPQ